MIVRFTSRKTRRGEFRQGLAAVEFALVAPLLGFIILGMFEASRLVMVKMVLDDAARKGCRTGICQRRGTTAPSSSSTGSNIAQDVIDVLHENKLDPTKATLTVTVGAQAPTTYTVSGSAGSYIATQSGGSGADPRTASGGTKIQVKVAMPVSSFSWAPTYFIAGATVESESVSMAKQ